MRALALALLTCFALAGCSGGGGSAASGDDAESGDAGSDGLVDGDTRLQPPTWQVGQWWTLSSEQSPNPFTHVVSANGSDDYTLDTDSPDIAFFNARFDISFLGPVRKTDLAGSQGSTRVQFFQFPLTAHKSWTTKWDGFDLTINVTSVADGLAKLEARHENDTLYATYSFDGKTGYFRDYAFYGPDGTTVGFAAKATAAGKDFAGDLVRWELETLFEAHGTFPGARETSFNLDTGITDVWIDTHVVCATGAFSLTVGPASGFADQRGVSANGPCPMTFDSTDVVTPPAMDNEQWGVFLASAPPDQGSLDLAVIARTLTTFKPGAAPA